MSYPLADKADVQPLQSSLDPIIVFDDWEVRELALSWEKIDSLWDVVKEYRSIFSDMTRDDKANFHRLLVSPDTFWLEACQAGKLAALIYFMGLGRSTDVEAHLLAFDRDSGTKVELVRRVAAYMFDTFPLGRITAPTPDIYFATKRMLLKAGFVKEGVKRRAFLLNGRWTDVAIYGLTREPENGK